MSDTVATYRKRGNGRAEVLNRCKRADGSVDGVLGMARPGSPLALRASKPDA